jgi:hypothetical protein
MPRSAVEGVDHTDWFRVFDPTTADLTFWSQDFNLQQVVNEAQRILPKLRELLAPSDWPEDGRA